MCKIENWRVVQNNTTSSPLGIGIGLKYFIESMYGAQISVDSLATRNTEIVLFRNILAVLRGTSFTVWD